MKRFTDILFLMILSLPLLFLLFLTSLLVWFFLGRPIFYSQERIGLNGVPFKLIKFRSMVDKTDKNGLPLPDEERITTFGSFLRNSSLDEIPETWNILKGDMTFVGPRPLLPEYMELYTEEQSQRHKVKSGLTGLAQINGRNDIEWEERLQMDVEYVRARSIWLDIKILAATMGVVILRKGIHKPGYVSMPKFTKNIDNDA